MTESEVRIIAERLASLEGTFRTECGHITKRLDSHSKEIGEVKSSINDINLRLTTNEAVDQVKCQYADKAEAHAAKSTEFWRQTWVQVLLALFGCAISSSFGAWLANHWATAPR